MREFGQPLVNWTDASRSRKGAVECPNVGARLRAIHAGQNAVIACKQAPTLPTEWGVGVSLGRWAPSATFQLGTQVGFESDIARPIRVSLKPAG